MGEDGVAGVFKEIVDRLSLGEAAIEGGNFGPVAALFGAMDDQCVLH